MRRFEFWFASGIHPQSFPSPSSSALVGYALSNASYLGSFEYVEINSSSGTIPR